MNAGWVRYDAYSQTLTLSVYVQPNARTTALAGLHGEDLKVRIAAPALDNKANATLRVFIAELLDVPPSAVTIRHGATSRRKTLEVRNAGAHAATRARALAGDAG